MGACCTAIVRHYTPIPFISKDYFGKKPGLGVSLRVDPLLMGSLELF